MRTEPPAAGGHGHDASSRERSASGDNRKGRGFPLSMRYIPEGRLMPTYLMAKEADTRMRRSQSRWRTLLRGILYLAIFLAAVGLIQGIIAPAALSLLPNPLATAARAIADILPVGLLFWAALFYMFYRLERPRAQRAAREVLNEHGIAICIDCGYDMRNLPADTLRCPECGRSRAGADDAEAHTDPHTEPHIEPRSAT